MLRQAHLPMSYKQALLGPTSPPGVTSTMKALSTNRRASMSDFNDANRDPLTNEPGSHPVGTGVGAALGGAAAEAVNPTEEDAYWRESFHREPYYVGGRTYEQYRPAYELGWSSVGRYEGD